LGVGGRGGFGHAARSRSKGWNIYLILEICQGMIACVISG
jgi:hypothetical protein